MMKAYRVKLEVRAQVEVDVIAHSAEQAAELAEDRWRLGAVLTRDVEVDSVEEMERDDE